MSITRRLLKEVSTSRGLFGLIVLLGLAAGGLVILQAQNLGSLINRVFLGTQTREAVGPLFGTLILIVILRSILTAMNGAAVGWLAARIKLHVRQLLLEKISRLGPSFTSGEATGELATTALQGVDGLDAYFSQYLPQILLAAILPLMILVVVFPLDLLTGVIFLVTAPLIPFFMWLVGRASENETRKQWQSLSRLGSYFLDTLQGITSLKALGQSKARTRQIRDVSERYREITLGVLRVTFLSALTLELLATISTAVVAVEVGLRLLYSQLGFEQALVVLLLAPEFYLPMRALGARFHAGMTGVSAATRIYEVLDTPEPNLNLQLLPKEEVPNLSSGFTIRFQDVSFVYPERALDSLKNLTFSLESGKVYGLIGPSGAGKTTLMLLLLRFINVSSGAISLNGHDFYTLPLEDWRRQISWVPQQPSLLNTSIFENIRLAKPGASLDEVRAAAEKARLDRLVMSLPQKYDTPVFERGSRLSAGEGQRIALARAFLKEAPFLLMDEPTAHLDIELEDELNAAVERLLINRTVMIIAHRFSTVKKAQHLLLLDHGNLAGSGSPADLQVGSSAYREFFKDARMPQ